MVPRAELLYRHSSMLVGKVAFIEAPFHDKHVRMKQQSIRELYSVSPDFEGLVTLHGEGETDGIRKIMFSSSDSSVRMSYCVDLVNAVITARDVLGSKLAALIIHPPTRNRRFSREQEIEWLADSLSILVERLGSVEVCIESRGSDRQGKILRAQPQDILLLQDYLRKRGTEISHCLDVAQCFACFGMSGVLEMVLFFAESGATLTEIHASDVSKYSTGQPRVSMPIGRGLIDWKNLLPHVIRTNARILIEVIGGMKPCMESLDFLNEQILA
jgi:hypothetical protein